MARHRKLPPLAHACRQVMVNQSKWMERLTRDTSPMVLNSARMVPNAIHDGEIGREGYFPPTSGTSEGQFSMIRAMAHAFIVTGIPEFKTRAIACGQAALGVMYRQPGNTVPALGTIPFMPHWLFSAKGGFKAKGPKSENPRVSYGSPAKDGVHLAAVQFSGGVGQLPANLAEVYFVATDDASLLWPNVLSGLTSGTKIPVAYFVHADGYEAINDGGTGHKVLKKGSANPKGSVKLAGSYASFTGQLRVEYSTFTGDDIPINGLFDAWPMWREVMPQESSAAFDTLFWAWDAFNHLAAVDPEETKWARARDLTYQNIVYYSDVGKLSSFWFRQDALSSDPFSDLGTGGFTVPATGGPPTAFSRVSGLIQMARSAQHPNSSPGFHRSVLAANTVYMKTQTGTTIQVAAKADAAVSIELELRPSDVFDEALVYFADLDLPANGALTVYNVPMSSFIRGRKSRWKGKDAASVFGSATMSQTLVAGKEARRFGLAMTADQFGGGIVSPANWSGFTQPPAWTGTVSGSELYMGIEMSGGGKYYASLANGTGRRALGWNSFRRRDASTNYAFGPYLTAHPGGTITSVSFEGLPYNQWVPNQTPPNYGSNVSVNSTGYVEVWDVENYEQVALTAGIATTVLNINDYKREPHAVQFGDVKMNGNALETLPYTPGVVPFTVDVIGSTLKSWRGAPYCGYQSGFHWVVQGDTVRANNLWAFLKAGQDDFAAKKGITGPWTPVFRWPRWETKDADVNGTWTWDGADPNSKWGGYQARTFLEVARQYEAQKRLYAGTLPAYAASVVEKYIDWLYAFMQANFDQAPTDYPETGPVVAGYKEPHIMALLVRGAIWANLAGLRPARTTYIIEKGLRYILLQYNRADAPADIVGSFATTGSSTSTDQGWTYYGFWAAEISEALSLYIRQHPRITRTAPAA